VKHQHTDNMAAAIPLANFMKYYMPDLLYLVTFEILLIHSLV